MNVNNVNRGLAVYQNVAPAKSAAAHNKKLQSKGNDSITLSDTAKDFKIAIDAIKSSPDIRYDKIARLKEEFDADNYKVNLDDISEKILKQNFDAIGF